MGDVTLPGQADLSPAKQALLARRLAASAAPADHLQRRPHDGTAPVSFAQRRLWFLDRLQPDSPAYLVPVLLGLTGPLDVRALEQSLHRAVSRHEILRTGFAERDDEPIQVIAASAAPALSVLDLCHLAPAARQQRLRELLAVEAGRTFDLAAPPLLRAVLFRVGDGGHRLLLNLHHMIIDGWSLRLLIEELVIGYQRIHDGQPESGDEPPIQYADFARWQQERMRAGAFDKQLAYWRTQLAGVRHLDLPTDRPRPAVQAWRGARHQVLVGDAVASRLRALARASDCTLFMVLLAALQALLSRYCRQDDVTVGTMVANRGTPEVERLIGFVANTIALRTDTSGDPPFRRLLARVREVALAAYHHQDAPYEMVVGQLGLARDPGRNPLFQVSLALEDGLPTGLPIGDARVDSWEFAGAVAKFDLSLTLVPDGAGLHCEVEYSTDLFDAGSIEQFAGHYRDTLAGAAADPDRRLSTLPSLDEAERRWWRGPAATPVTVPAEPVHRLVRRQVHEHPDGLAVVAGTDSITYRELDRRASDLAGELRARGAGPEQVVGVCLDRGVDGVVALLGVLMSGAAYLPLDPAFPVARVADVLRYAGARLLVGRLADASRLAGSTAELVAVDGAAASPRPAAGHPSALPTAGRRSTLPDTLAYVIYTSGSTGTPKGVQISHQSLATMVACRLATYPLGRADRTTIVASPAFDASVWEIWPALVAGATLIACDDETRADPAELVGWLARTGVTTAYLPTPLAEAVLDEAWAAPTALHTLFTAGGVLHCRPGRRHPFQLVNLYGPTECTVAATGMPVSTEDSGGRRPAIGWPLETVRAYVLDRHARPVPSGIPGELFLGGAQVARGYRRDPARTADRFRPDPFAGTPGARMYATGDLVRRLPDGTLDFLGRVDDQVEIAGSRVEPAEVEAVLLRHPQVREVAVVARGAGPGRHLAAFVVARRSTGVTAADLRRDATGKLPGYLVPSSFILVDHLPFTSSGKVDRRALASMPVAAPPPAPGTGTEQLVADVWRETLDAQQVSMAENFFELGGNSFLAIAVIRRLRQRLGRRIPVLAIFQHPTVSALARYLDAPPDQDLGAGAGQGRTESHQWALARRAALARPRPARPPGVTLRPDRQQRREDQQ